MLKYFSFGFLSLLALSAPGHVSASDTDELLPMDFSTLMNQKVITVSKNIEEMATSSGNLIVINRKDIRNNRYHNLVDVLDQLPGFHIQRHTTNTRYHRIGWRGHVENNRFIIMLDGVRITDPSGSSIAITDNFSLEHIERIEVLYGPASALYGADAAAGVINLISRSGQGKVDATLDLQSGSFHSQRLEGAVSSSLGDHASLLLSAHASRSDTANLAAYYPQDFAPVDATTFAGSVVVPAANREKYRGPVSANSVFAKLQLDNGWMFGIYHNRDVHLTSTGDKPSAVIYNPNSIWQQDITTMYSKKTWLLSDNLSAATTINGSRLEISPTSSYQNIFVDFQSTYKYMRNDRLELDQHFSWQATPKHNLLAGFNLGVFGSIPKTADLSSPINPNVNIAAQAQFYPNTTLPMTLYDLHYHHQGVFFQTTSQWTSVLNSTLGLRYDRDSRYGGNWNPRLSVVYRPQPTWSWKLMYGEAFRAPSTFESYETFGSFSGATNAAGQFTAGFFHVANPNLKPEKTRTLEATMLATPLKSLFVQTSIYMMQVNNLIFTTQATDPALGIPGASIGYIETTANLGRERSYGAELLLRHQWFLDNDVRGEISASYSYIDGTLNQGKGAPTADLPFVAKQHLRLHGKVYWHQWELGSKAHFVSKTSSNTVDPLNPSQTLKVPGYALFDLHFGTKQWFDFAQFDVDIFNVLDRRYYNSNGSGVRFLRSQQSPRSIIASLRMDL